MLLNCLLLLFVGICMGQRRPNFVLIITDDQDETLGGMTPMSNVRKFVAEEGVTFANSYTSVPICCPSRAGLLTGLYPHNHHTVNNTVAGGCYGDHWRSTLQHLTVNNLLQDAGYSTFYAGKYLNEYGLAHTGGPEVVPAGWSDWHGLVGNSVYYNYTLSNNGVPTFSADQYLTDIIRELGVSFIENQTEAQPFFMVLAPPAPHHPFTPAPRHRGAYSNITALRIPNFNIAAQDKHWLLQMPPSPLPEDMLPELDRVYRERWEAMLAVDEMVADIVGTLDTQALLDETYLIYTSDNGYHVGQFAQVYDKRQPYESDIKVPLIIKGPAARKKKISQEPALNIDLAPTILHLAGIEPPKRMDGRVLDVSGDGERDRYMLIEYTGSGTTWAVDATCPWKYDGFNLDQCLKEYDCKCQDSRNNTYSCVRHLTSRLNYKYCEFKDDQKFVEAYDLATDPYELDNIRESMFPAMRHWYSLILSRMASCSGTARCDDPLSI